MKQVVIPIKIASILYIGVICLYLIPLVTKAQEPANIQEIIQEDFNPLTDDITKKIPELEELINAAIENSHKLKYLQNQVKLSNYNLKTSRRDWTKFFYLAGNVSEGSSSSLTYVEDQFGNSVGTLGNTDQTRWTIGLQVRLPLFNIYNYKNQVNIAKVEIEGKIEQKLEAEKEIRAQVITLYNELVIQQSMLRIDIDNIEYASLASEMAEKEYQQNKISLGEMSRIRDVLSRARSRHVTTKINFINAYVMLQELTGVKFSELNNWE